MEQDVEKETVRKIFWRVVPIFFVGIFFNFFDRFNIGFAALRMNQDLNFDPVVFGFGASLLYFGYVLLGVPSNFLLHRVGARKWLGLIVIGWGVISCLTAFVWNAHSFWAERFLLGAAEAGFQPGAALYVTYWFPAAYRARVIGAYIIGGQIALVVGAPISGVIMTTLDNVLGLHGWQWMFLIESTPAILLGIAMLFFLKDRPAMASWLTPLQRQWLEHRLTAERQAQERGHPSKLIDIVADRRVWSLGFLFGFALVGVNALNIWLPQIVRELGRGHLSLIQLGFLSAIPALLGVFGILFVSWSSDRTGDRKYHLAAVYMIAAAALIVSAYVKQPILAYAMLCLVGLTINSSFSLFWSLNTSLLTGVAAAGSIAFVNTVAQFGGLIGPWMSGYIKHATGNFSLALAAMAGFVLLAALIALTLRVPRLVKTAEAVMTQERVIGRRA